MDINIAEAVEVTDGLGWRVRIGEDRVRDVIGWLFFGEGSNRRARPVVIDPRTGSETIIGRDHVLWAHALFQRDSATCDPQNAVEVFSDWLSCGIWIELPLARVTIGTKVDGEQLRDAEDTFVAHIRSGR